MTSSLWPAASVKHGKQEFVSLTVLRNLHKNGKKCWEIHDVFIQNLQEFYFIAPAHLCFFVISLVHLYINLVLTT